MNVEDARKYCLSKAASNESFPFDEETLVFKVVSKMFAVIPLEWNPPCIVLKCDPVYAIQLREEHNGITDAWHFNKKHWNSVNLDEIKDDLIISLIDHSYDLVYNKLTRKEKESI